MSHLDLVTAEELHRAGMRHGVAVDADGLAPDAGQRHTAAVLVHLQLHVLARHLPVHDANIALLVPAASGADKLMPQGWLRREIEDDASRPDMAEVPSCEQLIDRIVLL